MLESWKWQRPVKKNLFVINVIWRHLLSAKWKFQSFGRRKRCFHWNQNGKWQIVVIWEHYGAILIVYISSITCAPCKTSSDWIRVLVTVTNEILKHESSKCILDLPRVERRGTFVTTSKNMLGIYLNNTIVSNHFHSVKILLFSSARSRDFDGMYSTIFASQGLRFESPFSPPLADLEYITAFMFIELSKVRS
jgi:hypothetical protein